MRVHPILQPVQPERFGEPICTVGVRTAPWPLHAELCPRPEPGATTGGWHWEHPARLTTDDLAGIWMVGAEEGWAVGADGRVFRGVGSSWCAEDAGVDVALNAVWAAAPDDVWVVGEAGTILHRGDHGWQSVAGGGRHSLRAVFGVSPEDAWAVGDAGSAVHWDGTAWTPFEIGDSHDFSGVWGSGAGSFWAVGRTRESTIEQTGDPGSRAVAAAWDGSAWRPVQLPECPGLKAIWGSSDRDVWAVGDRLTLLHWDGTAWTSVGVERHDGRHPSDLASVWGSSTDRAFAVGSEDGIFEWDGGRWTPASSLGSGSRAAAVSGFGDSHPWAVLGCASSWDCHGGGIVVHTGHNWQPPVPSLPWSLTDVWGTASDDVWVSAAGTAYGDDVYDWQGVQATLLHWDGRAWLPLADGPAAHLGAVFARSPVEVWAVGGRPIVRNCRWPTRTSSRVEGWDDAVFRWDGSRWQELQSDSDALLNAVWVDPAGRAWVGGIRPVIGPEDADRMGPIRGIVARQTENGWQAEAQAFGVSALHGAGPDDVWAVGSDGLDGMGLVEIGGVALRWSEGHWTLDRSAVVGPTVDDPRLVRCREPDSKMPLRSLWVLGPDDVWSVGDWSRDGMGSPASAMCMAEESAARTPASDDATGPPSPRPPAVPSASMHWNGHRWTLVPTDGVESLADLWAAGPTDLWAVGPAGAIVHGDGRSWERVRSGTAKDIIAIWGADDGTLWAITEGAGILHATP